MIVNKFIIFFSISFSYSPWWFSCNFLCPPNIYAWISWLQSPIFPCVACKQSEKKIAPNDKRNHFCVAYQSPDWEIVSKLKPDRSLIVDNVKCLSYISLILNICHIKNCSIDLHKLARFNDSILRRIKSACTHLFTKPKYPKLLSRTYSNLIKIYVFACSCIFVQRAQKR